MFKKCFKTIKIIYCSYIWWQSVPKFRSRCHKWSITLSVYPNMLCIATSIQLCLEKNHITTSFFNSKQFPDTDSKGKKITLHWCYLTRTFRIVSFRKKAFLRSSNHSQRNYCLTHRIFISQARKGLSNLEEKTIFVSYRRNYLNRYEEGSCKVLNK